MNEIMPRDSSNVRYLQGPSSIPEDELKCAPYDRVARGVHPYQSSRPLRPYDVRTLPSSHSVTWDSKESDFNELSTSISESNLNLSTSNQVETQAMQDRPSAAMFSHSMNPNINGGHFVATGVLNQYFQISSTPNDPHQLPRTDMGSHAMRPNEQPNLLVFYGLPTLVDLWTDFDQGRQYMNEYYNGRIAPEAYGATQTQAQSIGNAGPLFGHTTASPIRTSQDIYIQHMVAQRRGYPLWIPEPSGQLAIERILDGFIIGDVGMITKAGSFDLLFNACLPKDHPVNPQTIDPHLSVLPFSDLDVQRNTEFGLNSHLTSRSVKVSQQFDSDQGSTSLKFEPLPSALEGAILTMPLGAISEDILGLDSLRRFVAAQAQNWYRHALSVRSRSVRNGDMRLIIGCDKAAEWGMATFNRQREEIIEDCYFTFRSGAAADRGARTTSLSDTSDYYWEYSAPSAQVRTGRSKAAGSGCAKEADGCETEAECRHRNENQTLFVRTLNITLHDRVWRNMMSDRELPLRTIEFSVGSMLRHPGQSVLSADRKEYATSDASTSDVPHMLNAGFAPNQLFSTSSNRSANGTTDGGHSAKLIFRNAMPFSKRRRHLVSSTSKDTAPTHRSERSRNRLRTAVGHTLYIDDHPSNVLSRFLLQSRPQAEMAIIDDNDWISLLTENDETLPSTEELLERVTEFLLVHEEGGVVFFRRKSKLPTRL